MARRDSVEVVVPAARGEAPASAGFAPFAVWAMFALAFLYPLVESRAWSQTLWGAHALAFLPAAWWLLWPALAPLLAAPVADSLAGALERWRPPPKLRSALPLLAGALALCVWWVVRERHLFWGDALPLSINVPAGQSFHPDEPLTLWLHHTAFALGGGRWSAASAIAFTSVLAGALWVSLAVRALLGRGLAPGMALLATLVLASQGGAALFHGHVENYSWLALCMGMFAWTGLEYLEGRGRAWPPILALVVGYACHLLGALSLPPALLLVAYGLARRARRAEMAWTLAGAVLLVAGAAWAVRGLYPSGDAFGQLGDGILKVLRQPRDMQPGVFFAWRHVADAWSHAVQMGPLSLACVSLMALLLARRGWLVSPGGRFLVVAAITGYAPSLLTGEGNLGAARNWDLFAAPSLTVSLVGVLLLIGSPNERWRHRLMFAALAASLALSLPWIALNLDADRTEQRVASLPLGRGRSAAMLGTAALNAGKLDRARAWFVHSLAQDSLNLNAWSGLGLSLARAGRYVEAERPLGKAVQLKPHDAQYRRDLASLYMQRSRWSAASEQWQAALVLDHATAAAWLGLSEALARAGREDSAVFALVAARAALPADASLRAALADACARWVAGAGHRGDRATFARAWHTFETRCPDDPRVKEWRPRADALLRGGP